MQWRGVVKTAVEFSTPELQCIQLPFEAGSMAFTPQTLIFAMFPCLDSELVISSNDIWWSGHLHPDADQVFCPGQGLGLWASACSLERQLKHDFQRPSCTFLWAWQVCKCVSELYCLTFSDQQCQNTFNMKFQHQNHFSNPSEKF